MKPLVPLRETVDGVKGRLELLTDLGPRVGFFYDRFCDRAESVYYWFARLPKKLKALAHRRTTHGLDELTIAHAIQEARRCPLRRFKATQSILNAVGAAIRWLQAHPSARATLVSSAALGVLMAIHSAMGLSDGLTMAYVVPIWLATRLGGLLSGLLSVVFTTVAMNHADSLRGTLDTGGFSHTTVVRLSTLTVIMFFIAHIEARLQRAERMASTDALTGLKNRAAIAEFAQEEIERALSEQTSLTVAAIDCDKFKLLNDSYGHAFGDMALKTLARKLEAAVGERGAVARLGGDEFVVVFLGITADEAHKILERGADRFQRHMSYFGWTRTMSYGLSELIKDARDFDTLLRKADLRLYDSKRLAGQIEAVSEEQTELLYVQ